MVDKQLIYSIIDNKIDILDLSNKNINKENFHNLLNALHFNKTIKNINLSNFQIGSEHIKYNEIILILNSLKNASIIEALDISSNMLKFKNEGVFNHIDYYININIFSGFASKNQKDLINSNFSQFNKIIDDINHIYDLNVLIEKLQKIKTLNLSYNQINENPDFLIKLLKNNTKLEKLDISYNNIYDNIDDWTYLLKDNTTLKELKIHNYNSNLYTTKTFENIIKNAKHLTDLSLWIYNNKNYNFNEEIANKLNSSSLKVLTINGKGEEPLYDSTGITRKNLIPLFSMLKTNTSITKLNLQALSLNKPNIDNYKYLNEMLECNKTIKTLEFEKVRFSNTEFKKFIQNLYFNKTIINLKFKLILLSTVDKNFNIDNELAELIKNNDTLQSLDLNVKFLRDLSLFINNLKENKTLNTLKIYKNIPIKDEDINEIQQYNKNISIIKLEE